MATETFSILALGFGLGVKHALDTDHLVAVAAIVSERKNMLSSSLVGALWGIGHTASLLAVGLVILLFDIQLPETFSHVMEFVVALMLIILGIIAIKKVARGDSVHIHQHEHEGRRHIHLHVHNHSENQIQEKHHHELPLFTRLSLIAGSKKPLYIGMVHGLAGSGALMLLILSTIPSTAMGLLYIGTFGVGSMLGMLMMSALISVPFFLSAKASHKLNNGVRLVSGILSICFGIFFGYQIAFVDGLFL
ncbi:MAG: urease accessory protein UreH [Ignavibacteriae bacterium]|nr:urease accessory protein UreH [Ignavibacteriota bacterium]